MADEHDDTKLPVSRRAFLKGVGLATAAATIPVVVTGCDAPVGAPAPMEPPVIPAERAYPEVPYAPAGAADPSLLRTFTPHEARTVEALTARILPGTPEDPGAREAGVMTFIDQMLAHDQGFVEKTYRMPPYAELFEGEPPPSTLFQQVPVAADQIERYGVQSLLSPREIYRLGVIGVDRFARERHGGRFIELDEAGQDDIVGAMAKGEATGFEPFSGAQFFQVLRRHTAQGMFSDPAYGGNRGMVGWALIGYPGAQRAYTPQEIRAETPPRPPQSLAQLSRFHAGQHAEGEAVLPVSGSEEQFPVHAEHP